MGRHLPQQGPHRGCRRPARNPLDRRARRAPPGGLTALYVGTSGWAYREWKPAFYPAEVPQARFLEHYSTVLTACEINATFYRLQSDKTLDRWTMSVPESFRFATKAHRGLTHGKEIAPGAEQRGFLDTYLKSVGRLGMRLGAVLFQYPPYRQRDDAALAALLTALPAGTRYAFEFRHESWTDEEVVKRIGEAGATVCLSESKGDVPDALPPGPIAYIRLRSDRYSPEARDAWRALLEKEAQERDVYAFCKHEGIPTDDPYGGIGLARWLTGTWPASAGP